MCGKDSTPSPVRHYLSTNPNTLTQMTVPDRLNILRYHSPYGIIWLGESEGMLRMADWEGGRNSDVSGRPARLNDYVTISEHASPTNVKASLQLDEYFNGSRHTFDIPTNPCGTDFQKKVWKELLNVPYGKTATYGDIARFIGMPKATRAVANAIGRNPISIFIPCHRIIGSNHSLTGYAGGIATKKRLLDLESGISALF